MLSREGTFFYGRLNAIIIDLIFCRLRQSSSHILMAFLAFCQLTVKVKICVGQRFHQQQHFSAAHKNT